MTKTIWRGEVDTRHFGAYDEVLPKTIMLVTKMCGVSIPESLETKN